MPASPVEERLQVGVPDPEFETSQIVSDEDDIEVEPNVVGGACRFNGVVFRIGQYVLSGTELLRCEAPGVWVSEGEIRPRTRGAAS